MVGAFYGRRKIFEASLVAPADIAFGDIVAARENSISDSSEVDFNIFGSDVDQHDFETTISRIGHHLQIVLSGQRGFDREVLAVADVLPRRSEDLARGRDWKRSGQGSLKRLADHVRIE